MLHNRIRLGAGKDSIDVHVESTEHAFVVSSRYRERIEPYSDPRAGIEDWYLGQAERLLRMINSREEQYLMNLDSADGAELSEWALTTAHGSRGLSVALGARDQTHEAAARFEVVTRRASELLKTLYSYETELRTIN